MTKILVTYHSNDGQTAKIAERISGAILDDGVEVETSEVKDAPAPGEFDAVVVGDSIRFGRHSRALVGWLRRHGDALSAIPVGVFQVSMTSATSDREHDMLANELVDKLVHRSGVRPDAILKVAGALRYSHYGWVTTRVMRSIARREGNDTDTSHDHEYTDWAAVDTFAHDIVTIVAAKVGSTQDRTSGPA